MAKASRSENVPKEMQERFAEISRLTDAFGQEYLNEEWKQLCRQLTVALCRKRGSVEFQFTVTITHKNN